MLRKVVAYPCAILGAILLVPVAVLVVVVGAVVVVVCAIPTGIGVALLLVAYFVSGQFARDEVKALFSDAGTSNAPASFRVQH